MPLPTEKMKPKYDPGLLTILIYGPAGIGKSTFCSRAEEVLFLPTEPGLNAIEAYQYPLIETWGALKQAYEEIKTGNHKFKTIVIDTVNNAHKLCADYICRTNNVQHETDIPGNSKGYALINNEFYRLIKQFAGLPYGLFLTAHQREQTIKLRTGELTKVVPELPDKSRGHLVALADFVFRCDTEEVETDGVTRLRRIIHTKPATTYEAKDRFGVLPDPLPLSYPEFIKEFKDGMARRESKTAQAQNAQAQTGQTKADQAQTQNQEQGRSVQKEADKPKADEAKPAQAQTAQTQTMTQPATSAKQTATATTKKQ